MKRYTAVLAAAIVLISMIGAVLPLAARAQETVTYTVQTEEHIGVMRAGETMTVLICLDPVQKISSLQATLCYDPDAFEAVGGEVQNFLETEMVQSYVNTELLDPSTGEVIPGEVKLGGFALSDIAVSSRTVIATVTLCARRDVVTDEPFTLKDTMALSNSTRYECVTVDGALRVVRGDVDGDGVIDTADALAAFYAVNGTLALTTEQQAEADMDRDGYVTLRDAVTLFYYVNGKI